MDECLQALSQQREWEGDDLLVAQVKVQLIVEQLTRATSQSPDGVPPGYVLSTLRTQLQNTKTQLPIHLQHNGMLLLWLYAFVFLTRLRHHPQPHLVRRTRHS
jgi:hypothetical protein